MDFLVILDNAYKVTFVSKNTEDILGYTQQEIQSEILPRFLHPSDLDRFIECLVSLVVGHGSWFWEEFRFRHKRGDFIKLIASAHKVNGNNTVSGIILGLRVPPSNINKASQDHTMQEPNGGSLRQLYESINDGIVKTDLDGHIIEANKAYLDLLGVESLEEISGTLKDYTPEKWHNFEDEILGEDSLLNGYSHEYEKEYIRKDGSLIPIHIRKWLIRDDKGTPTGMWAIVRKVDKSKQTKHQLQHTIEELSLLNHYQLNEREKERAAIASTIHDELGQAMTALKVDLGWLLESIDNKEYCVDKIQKMLQITHDTIKLTQRVTAELRPGILDDLGLIPAIEWYCNEFEERSGIKCNIYLQNSCVNNRDIELNLFRILQESLTNVIRHSKANNVIVKLRCSPINVTLIIEDNGVGIPKEKLTSHKSFGLIGMRERVSYCSGTINLVSSKRGTIIRIDIPLTNDSTASAGEPKIKTICHQNQQQ
jgi:two-component system, NarL family, sensor histidine kinase UhpB